jgi:hypothetical protein
MFLKHCISELAHHVVYSVHRCHLFALICILHIVLYDQTVER